MSIVNAVSPQDALAELCAVAELDGREAQLLRICANAVFLLPRERTVARVASATVPQVERAQRCVRVAAWLEEIKFPAVRLRQTEPVVADGHVATFWHYLPQSPTRPDPARLAPLLRRFHELEPPFPLPEWDPLGEARLRLAEAGDLADGDRTFLASWCNRLDEELRRARTTLPRSLLHGDAWNGNLLRDNKNVLLSDLDHVCRGPREWDLVPTVVNAMRFGRPSSSPFLRAYGIKVTAWPSFLVLREVRELTMLTGALSALALNPSIRREFARRMADLRDPGTGRWEPYE